MADLQVHKLKVLSTDDPSFSKVARFVEPPPLTPEGQVLSRLPAGRKKTSYLRFVGAEGADSEHVGGVREDPAASLEEIAMKASEKDGARKMQLV